MRYGNSSCNDVLKARKGGILAAGSPDIWSNIRQMKSILSTGYNSAQPIIYRHQALPEQSRFLWL